MLELDYFALALDGTRWKHERGQVSPASYVALKLGISDYVVIMVDGNGHTTSVSHVHVRVTTM